MNLTIAIPARNEQFRILNMLASLVIAVAELPNNIKVRTIVCVNGSSDETFGNLLAVLQQKMFPSLNLKVIESEPGKMNAQRKIITETRAETDFYLWCDADIYVTKTALAALWYRLKTHPETELVYAHVEPQYRPGTFIHWLQRAHYKYRDKLLSPRKYFHARCFMTSHDNSLHLLHRGDEQHYTNQPTDIRDGPRIDDVHLSRVLAHHHGPDCMAEVSAAKVFFTPPATIGDFIRGQKRLRHELRRLDILFPGLSYTQKRYFVRHIKWNKVLRLRPDEMLHFLAYESLETVISWYVNKLLIPAQRKNSEQWQETPSTKSF